MFLPSSPQRLSLFAPWARPSAAGRSGRFFAGKGASRTTRCGRLAALTVVLAAATFFAKSPAASAPAPQPAAQPAKAPSAEFMAKFLLASVAYKQRNFEGTLQLLDQADSLQGDQADALNLRGLALLRRRDFGEAEKTFRRAIVADADFWPARFNLADLPFFFKNYTLARMRYEQLQSEIKLPQQRRELEFLQLRIFLTHLLEGNAAAARNACEKLNPTRQTSARFYARAALRYHAGRPAEGDALVAEGRCTYPAEMNTVFADGLRDVGWIREANP